MGKRLPPGEAERRAAERKRAFFAGETHKKYDPETDGYGDYAQWASMAAAFVDGDFFYAIDIDAPKIKRQNNPDFDILGLTEHPANLKNLTGFYRRAVKNAYMAAGSKDTAPEYVNAFMAITKAYDRIKRQRGFEGGL
jgi:hypothetical protein